MHARVSQRKLSHRKLSQRKFSYSKMTVHVLVELGFITWQNSCRDNIYWRSLAKSHDRIRRDIMYWWSLVPSCDRSHAEISSMGWGVGEELFQIYNCCQGNGLFSILFKSFSCSFVTDATCIQVVQVYFPCLRRLDVWQNNPTINWVVVFFFCPGHSTSHSLQHLILLHISFHFSRWTLMWQGNQPAAWLEVCCSEEGTCANSQGRLLL